jgi:hypothetical protein
MMEKSKRLFAMLLIMFISLAIFGQDATTSSMNGKIVDSKGLPLPGSTIIATHVPSGSIYGATANNQGFYSIQGMRPGGPYKVEITFVGFSKKTFTDITIQLGETYSMNTGLTESSTELGEVTVVGSRPSAFNTEKTGASTNVNNETMKMVPSMNRNLTDYTKLSPYASGGGTFVGRDAYTTNVTVDGANFNNNFGLSSGNMPGVSGEPISMEAIEEIQIAIAPFDVRQSNFTGAGVNAITKRGTNQIKASVYGFYRNQNFNGKKIRDTKLTVSESAKQAYGFNIGGPIIKDKLFFFISGEKENTLTPGNILLASKDPDGVLRDPADPNVNARVTPDSLNAYSDFLKSAYGYETGRYESWGGDNEFNNKALIKLDWNISKNHKLTVRYNYSESSSTSRPSNSGDARPSISTSRVSRTGGMTFENSQYFSASKLHSITGELNSRFGQLTNKILVAYTMYKQPRTSNSSVFPFVDIMFGNATTGDVQMSAGYELFSYKNNVDNNTLILTDNLTYQLDNHNITFGISYEHQYFANSYLRQGSGYYRFKSLQAFQNFTNGLGNPAVYNTDADPVAFAYTYPINGITNPLSELSFGQFSSYLQDEYSALENLKITAGLRIDLPMYFAGAIDNPAVKPYYFNNWEQVDLSTWPEAKVLWSPRLGFTWDVFKDRSLKVRGGTGVFTGRIPFVWFTNQPSNSGMIQYQLVLSASNGVVDQGKLARLPGPFPVNTAELMDPEGPLADIFPLANPAGGRIAAISKTFKLPQVWRTSMAFDIKLPLNMLLTLEGIYTKDINAIAFENINLRPAASTILEGTTIDGKPITRPFWSNSTTATKYIVTTTTANPAYPPYTDVVIMKNTKKGQGYSLSAKLDLPRIAGFNGMVAYTKIWGEELTGRMGSDPFSAWQYRVIRNSLNDPELGLSASNTPHRVIAAINYSIEYFKIFNSTISFLYNGYKGDAYSYLYSGDANSDGTSTHELMYIPNSANDFIWSTAQDAAAYFAYAAQDPYLSKHQGEYAYRNAAYNPWSQRFDMRFMQDFKVKAGNTTNTLQLSIDVINLLNLLDSSWGLNKSYITNSPIIFGGKDATTGKLKASMRKIGGQYVTKSFQDPSSVSGTWGIQVGVRYLFN